MHPEDKQIETEVAAMSNVLRAWLNGGGKHPIMELTMRAVREIDNRNMSMFAAMQSMSDHLANYQVSYTVAIIDDCPAVHLLVRGMGTNVYIVESDHGSVYVTVAQ